MVTGGAAVDAVDVEVVVGGAGSAVVVELVLETSVLDAGLEEAGVFSEESVVVGAGSVDSVTEVEDPVVGSAF